MPATVSSRRYLDLSDLAVPGDGSTDATTKLNQALATYAGKVLRGTPGRTYRISAPLVIYDDTTLDMTGCVVTLASGSDCNMIRNAALQAGTGRNRNIRVRGGDWRRGANGGTNSNLHTMMFQRVDGLRVHPEKISSTAGKYAVHILACTDFFVSDIEFDTASDGVHLQGACRGGVITRLRGTTGDDAVSLTPVDWSAYQNGDFGDIVDVEISHITTTCNNGGHAVKVLGGSNGGTAYHSDRISVHHIDADTTSRVVYIGGDAAQASTMGGDVRNMRVSHIRQRGSGHLIGLLDTGAGRVDNLELSHLITPDADSRRTINLDNTPGGLTVGTLTVRDTYAKAVTHANSWIFLNNGVVVEHLCLDRVTWDVPAIVNPILFNGTGSTIRNLKVNACRLKVATQSGGLIRTNQASHAIGEMHIRDLTVDQAAWALGDFAHTSATNVYISGLKMGTVSGIMFARTGTIFDFKSAAGIVGSSTIGSSGFTINSRSLGLPVDSGLLAQAAGDLCTNTNAARGNGVGPCVSNGTNWKNLYTGSTS